jgi:preprotein translocase subunit SecA
MQIIGPDGAPIDTDGPLAAELMPPRQLDLPAPSPAAPAPQRPAVPVPVRAPSTTIDALEKEFQRKKQRELDAARSAGGGTSSNGASSPRRNVEKVGRNEECPCGSGKKYKKCHGAAEA